MNTTIRLLTAAAVLTPLMGKAQQPADYVNPFIGASTSVSAAGTYHGLGKTFPGAATPFGMVQVSPNTITGGDNGSGYSYEHTTIEGFAFTQMSGIGWYGDLGNFLVMPTTGPLQTAAGSAAHPEQGYRSAYAKTAEKASAGYYSVLLTEHNIKAEMTAAPHSGILRFTFPASRQSRIQIDLARRVGGTSTWQEVKVIDDHTIAGYMRCTPDGGGWGNGDGKASYTVYFYAQFSKPLRKYGVWSADIPDSWSRKREDIESDRYQQRIAQAAILPGTKEKAGKHLGFYTEFATDANEVVLMKSGISFVSIEGAKANLEAEINDWNFDGVHQRTREHWNKALGKIKIAGGTEEEKKVFYTALYHTMIDPRESSDVDGRYLGADGKVYVNGTFRRRTIFSGWDVFRSQMPLQTIINPAVVNDEINSLVSLAEESGKGYLERWEILNAYSGCMIGNPAVAVIADAYAKGIRGFDAQKAYRFARNTVEQFGNGTKGYAAGGLSISLTLEYAYAEWCLGSLAGMLNEKDDEKIYKERGLNYRNVFDSAKGWFRPRNEDGSWMKWPEEGRMLQGYGTIESSPYQQGWFVPHDVPGMVALMGGKDKALADLTTFFDKVPENMMWNDYYNHANEPVHHVPFLFNRLGAPWLTQKWTREICARAYHDGVEGLVGNEDVGQMSAWYVLAASGLHPVCPGDPRYEITSPVFDSIAILLDPAYAKGKQFTIIARNNSTANRYIQRATLNGMPYNKTYIDHADIINGGTLVLEMGDKPDKQWGIAPEQQAARPDYNRFTKVVLRQKLEEPMQFQILNNGKILYAERKGKLKLFDPNTKKMEVIAEFNVSREYVSKKGEHSEGEDGLQGVILDPNYAGNHWIYVYYSPKEISVNRLSRFTWSGGKLDMRTEKVVLDVPVQREECCHVGGGMVFDKAGYLYLSTGDNTFSRSSDGFTPIDERPGESPRDAQKSSGNTNDLRGKILRILPNADGSYTIPEGNLFPPGTPKTRPEIYTMGNRNPWRLTIESRTGWLYWGEVGPDGSNASEQRGPRSYDEFNMAKKAGNFGWPYFIGKEAYRYYNFATKESGEWWDPAKPVNNSPNNTGLNILPPVEEPLIWYPYAASEEFPLMGSGGRSAVGGPIFHRSDFDGKAKSLFPPYYENKWLVTDWVRGWILAITLDEEGKYVSMERFLPELTLHGPIDMKFGPDGALYVLEYGNGYFKDNPEAELIRIEYNGGNRKPEVQVSADKTAGPLPLKVQLSSEGTTDADGDSLKYEWKVTRGGVLIATYKEANPVLKLTTGGVYKATLTVSDPAGARNSKSVEIAAGNAVPEVDFRITQGNSSFFFPGNTIRYAVRVNDKEDGSLANGKILPSQVSVSIDYHSEGYDMTVIAQNQHKFDAAAAHAGAKALLKKSDCNACHALNTSSLGPSFTKIAMRYKNDKTAQARLTKKVITGGAGVWGDAMMPAHSSMSTAEVSAIVKYILSLSEKNPVASKSLPVSGSYTTSSPSGQTNKGMFVLRAAYKDKGANLAPSQQGESVVLLRHPEIAIADADKLEGVTFNHDRNLATARQEGNYVLLKQIDLGGLKSLALNSPHERIDGAFEVRLDNVDGNVIGTSGSPDKEARRLTATLAETTGRHDVYIVFTRRGSRFASISVSDK